MSTTENMKLFLKERGIPITRFVSEIGMSVGYLYSTTDFSCEVIRKINRRIKVSTITEIFLSRSACILYIIIRGA